MVNINEMQFGNSTTDAIFIVRQPHYQHHSTLSLSTLRKPCHCVQGRSCGGPSGASVSSNGLYMSSRACTPIPCVVWGSMVSTMRSLAWELVCIRALSLAHCSSSWCRKCFRTSFAPMCPGSFSTLMTWCSLWNNLGNVSLSSRPGAWKAGMESKGLHVNVKKTKLLVSWVLVSSGTQASSHVQCATVELSTTSLIGLSTNCESTRSAAASLVSFWPTQIMSAPGVAAHHWQTSDSSGCRRHHAWCGCHFFLPGWHAGRWWGLWQCHCCQMLRGLGKVQETCLAYSHHQALMAQVVQPGVHGLHPLSSAPCYTD